MKSGIYLISDTIHDRVYVGQSVNVPQRLCIHKALLKRGVHKNVYLQRSYNKCNGDGFKFIVLEYCPTEKLDEREKAWIESFQSTDRDKGYNIQSGGHEGHTWNEEARAARSGQGNPMYGRHHSQEFVQRIRLINRASSDKLTVDNVEKIKQALADGVTQTELSKAYNVTISTINKISTCDNWSWVRSDLNDAIKNLEHAKKQQRNEKMRQMYLTGATAASIAKELNCNPSTVKDNIKDLVDARKRNRETLKMQVAHDYLSGVPCEEILKKYNISRTSYTRYTTKAFNEKKAELIKKVVEMRQSGMLVKDIASELGLHRTTVTEYCKKYGHGNTESA